MADEQAAGAAAAGAAAVGGGGAPGAITPEEHKAAIEKARLQERAKVHDEKQGLAAQVSDLTAKLAASEAAAKKLNDDLIALKASIKEGGSLDIEALIAKTADATQKQFAPQISKLQSELDSERAARKQAQLDQEKAYLVQQAAAEHNVPADLLSELVRGATSEGLTEAIDAKVALLKKTLPAGSANTNQGNANGGAGAGTGLPLPAASRGAGTPTPQVKSVRGMTDKEWVEKRQGLKQQAAARYTQPGVV